MTTLCRICGNNENLIEHQFSEKMLGTGDLFQYIECPVCGCIQIKEVPENLGDYYPSHYYSYKSAEKYAQATLRVWADTHRVNAGLGEFDLIGTIGNAISKPLEYIGWIKNSDIKRDSRILDVGCGQGRLLLKMAMGGFSNLTGIDPFIADDIHYSNGVTILKQEISAMESSGNKFDFIMLHHSLEHMNEQEKALHGLANILQPNGTLLIRIPLSDSYAWQEYRENWMSLDAPRHLYLHTRKSMDLLTRKCGLRIDKVIYDSSKSQFTISELYKQGIPFNAPKRDKKIFSRSELKAFEEKASKLNLEQRGDSAAFYIRHDN